MVGIFAQVQTHMKTLERNSDQLYSIDTKLETQIKKITDFNSRYDATAQKLATLKNEAAALETACDEIAQHQRSFDAAHDQLGTYLDKIRDRGLTARDKAKNACQNESDSKLVKETSYNFV